jgi:NAD(P)-dependent dehydrogenase (short-subunit alcohol dehydrogenase family)
MDTKTILITGATDGIGLAAAVEFTRMGHHVIVHGRSATRAEQAVRTIKRETKNQNVDFVLADFASLAHVRDMAKRVNEKYERLDLLINNAGVIMKKRVITEDRFEMTFQVNHLAHFLLTNLVLDLVRRSAPARIVTVASGTHRSGRIEWDSLNGEDSFDSYNAYATSKLANVLFAFELAARLEGSGVTSNALHPGVINTKLLRAGFSPFGANAAHGAEGLVYLATAPQLGGVTGKYFDRMKETTAAPAAHDRALRKKLWQVSADLVGLGVRS